MSPERVKSKRESMRNVERFLYVNTIAADNLNKIVANKLLVLYITQFFIISWSIFSHV